MESRFMQLSVLAFIDTYLFDIVLNKGLFLSLFWQQAIFRLISTIKC